MSNTALTIIPADLQLPAHLQTADAAAAIAAANAAAAGGIKSGSFPQISIKGGKFHYVAGGERTLIPDPNNPALPLMQLRSVVVAANPAIIKTYYAGEWVEGEDRAPDCSSDNGVTPDAHISAPQHPVCATCPKNQWGSSISKATGKETKACADAKRLVILAADALEAPAVSLVVTPSALKEWGGYVSTLSQKNIPVSGVVTLVTFDHTAAYPKLKFSFGGFLSAEQFALVQQREKHDDVKNIVSPLRNAVAVPALPAPAAPAQEPAAAPVPVGVAPAPAPDPVPVPPQAGPAPAAAPAGFAPPETAKRTRAPRKPPAEAVAATAQAAQGAAAVAQGIAATASAAATATATDPFAGLPPHVRTACDAAGAPGTPAFQQVYQALAGKPYPAEQVFTTITQIPAPAPAAPIVVPPPAAPAAAGFVPPVAPATGSPGQSLKERLEAKLAAANKGA